MVFFLGAYAFAAAQPAASVLFTEPGNATVLSDKQVVLGSTPFDLNQLPADVREIRVRKGGFENVELKLGKKGKKGYSFPEAVERCSGCLLTDSGSQPAGKPGAPVVLKLRKTLRPFQSQLGIAINTPVLQIDKRAELGRINGQKIKMQDKGVHLVIGYVENITAQLIKPFEGTQLDASPYSVAEEGKTRLLQPKVVLTPVIKNLEFTLHGRLYRDYTGPAAILTEWQVSALDLPESPIARLPVLTRLYRTGPNYEIILTDLLAQSARDLLENDTLPAYLEKIETQYLNRKRAKPNEIKRPPEKQYASGREMLKEVVQSVVTIENQDGFGSGVIISEDGYIVTNNHVVTSDLEIRVFLDERAYKAKLIAKNPDFDLALLKIDADSLKALRFSNTGKAETGDEVYAIGTPLSKRLGKSVAKGIVSGNRAINGVRFIQTDVSMNSGNSGGPIVNEKGEILGISTIKLTGNGVEGLGFGIVSSEVINSLNLQLY